MITVEPFEGHLILWAKNTYKVDGVDLITSIKRIWAVRCGIPIYAIDNAVLPIIATELYKLLLKVKPNLTPQHLQEQLHLEIAYPTFYLKYCSPIELIVWFYRNQFTSLQIKDGDVFLIKLPKPNNYFFEKIISGNYENNFDDYKLLEQ